MGIATDVGEGSVGMESLVSSGEVEVWSVRLLRVKSQRWRVWRFGMTVLRIESRLSSARSCSESEETEN